MVNLFFIMTFQRKPHTNSYLSNDKELFTCSLSWVQDQQECHLNRNARVISSEKNSLVTTADVFNSEFKTIQSFKQQRFSVQQRESDRIELFVMLRITLLSQSSYLSQRNYFKCNALQIFVVSFTFTAQKIDRQETKTNRFTQLSSCFQLRHYWTPGHQNTHFPVWFCL